MRNQKKKTIQRKWENNFFFACDTTWASL